MDFTWLNLTEIILQLLSCWACFWWGKNNGIGLCIEALLHRKIITEKDLEKLND